MHTHVFHRLVGATALAQGMPGARQAYVPQPLVGRSAAELKHYIEGNDAITGRPFMQEVIEGLTSPLGDEDLIGVSFERTTPRLVEPDSEDNLQALFNGNQWTDHLPVILPTEARVEAMLAGTTHAPDEVVGRLRPTAFREFWEFTVEKVAINAVMAGARPEYLPVILALAASGQTARSSSTTSFGTLSVVNGPIRDEIGMSSGIGIMGPFNHANTTIGRAYNLLSLNLQGGSEPGDTYMGSLGNAYNHGATFAEAEERSPWRPLHVQRGFEPGDSAVSIFVGGRYTLSGYGPRALWQEQFRTALAACENHSAPLIVLDPGVARDFAALGFDTKEKLIEWCAENARQPARQYWDDFLVTMPIQARALGLAGVEPYATRVKAGDDEEIRMFRPDEINIVVAGGETQAAWKMIGARLAPEATVSIDDWR